MHEKTIECAQALTDYKRLLQEMSAIELTLGLAVDAITADRANIRSGNPQTMPSRTRSALKLGRWPTPDTIEALLTAIRAEKLIAQAAWQRAPVHERTKLDFPIAWHPDRNTIAPAPAPAPVLAAMGFEAHAMQ